MDEWKMNTWSDYKREDSRMIPKILIWANGWTVVSFKETKHWSRKNVRGGLKERIVIDILNFTLLLDFQVEVSSC